MRIGIIGATGVVGREIVTDLLALTESEEKPFETPRLFSTAKSAGEVFGWVEDEELVVEPYEADAARGLEAVIVATPPEAAKTIVPRLRQLGVTVIDLSRAHRDSAPLFFDGSLVPNTSWSSVSLISLPSAEALAIARVVSPLQALRPRWVRASLFRPASGAGQAGVEELAESTGRLLNGQEPENPKLGHRLAFNAIPQVGAFAGASSEAELDVQQEVSRLLQGIPSACTAAWGPWFYGLFGTLTIGFEGPASLDAIRTALGQSGQLKVLDSPAEAIYPMPSLATGDEMTLVGRLRPDPIESTAVQLVFAIDNARAAAALAVSTLRTLSHVRQAH